MQCAMPEVIYWLTIVWFDMNKIQEIRETLRNPRDLSQGGIHVGFAPEAKSSFFALRQLRRQSCLSHEDQGQKLLRDRSGFTGIRDREMMRNSRSHFLINVDRSLKVSCSEPWLSFVINTCFSKVVRYSFNKLNSKHEEAKVK